MRGLKRFLIVKPKITSKSRKLESIDSIEFKDLSLNYGENWH